MGATDGRVVGTTKVVDHGADARRWNLVILSEGYREPELPTFHADVDAFVARLHATPPFTERWCAINVHRVDVASDDSGADDPATCADGSTGTGATPDTYFDASYCTAGLERLLHGDDALALATAQAAVPAVRATVVIVNNTKYGGAGGAAAWFSRAPDAALIGIHELAHSAFGLADEYTDRDDAWAGGEPLTPNVTTITDRATTKWAARIAPGTPLPTMSNPDCTQTDSRPSPVAAGTVGLFEGSGRARCGAYRPEHDCMMRTLAAPFCAVCRAHIAGVLRPFMALAPAASAGVQFRGTVAAGATQRFFTHSWPACWHVLWSVVPVSFAAGEPDIAWRLQVERASRERLTYWLAVTNRTAEPVEVEGRYTILARD